MSPRKRWGFTAYVLLLGAAGCATHFSPQAIRQEIARQTGKEPERAFELNLGEPTLRLVRSVFAGADGDVSLQGLTRLELAVYGLPQAGGAAFDATRMAVRGWEPVVRTAGPGGSAMVLTRSGGSPGDVVLLVAGQKQVLYARLQGHLAAGLPEALAKTAADRGPEGTKDDLLSVTEPPD